MNKKITIGTKPSKATPASPGADDWVSSQDDKSDRGRMKRLTIDIPEGLHRSIKVGCASRGTNMADEIREVLLQKYDPS